uniref:DFDF domain-containing protein n=1 Tax=Mycena chlorophos TaxID=658473 RepID=A0ABQ0LX08_MYCCL|nr:predicted protein [Mycena chlorophos]
MAKNIVPHRRPTPEATTGPAETTAGPTAKLSPAASTKEVERKFEEQFGQQDRIAGGAPATPKANKTCTLSDTDFEDQEFDSWIGGISDKAFQAMQEKSGQSLKMPKEKKKRTSGGWSDGEGILTQIPSSPHAAIVSPTPTRVKQTPSKKQPAWYVLFNAMQVNLT